MTVKEYMRENKWNKKIPHYPVKVEITFWNWKPEKNTVTFSFSSYHPRKLKKAFHRFCKENNYHPGSIAEIKIVK